MGLTQLGPEFDIPDRIPDVRLALDAVGTTARVFPLTLDMPGASRTTLTARVALSVSLSHDRRGVHMSRFGRALQDRLGSVHTFPQELAVDLATVAMGQQGSSSGSATLMFSWSQHEPTPTQKSLQSYEVEVWARVTDAEALLGLRVAVPSIIACPCVQINALESIGEQLVEAGFSENDLTRWLRIAPLFSHSQRILVGVGISGPDLATFDFRELIRLIRGVVPGSYDTLRRPDEVALVKKAHQEPMFCEDVTRLVAREVARDLSSSVPGSTRLVVETTSFESIHSYDLVARLESRICDILQDLGS